MKTLINTYVYKYNENLLSIDRFFSDYRLEKIDNNFNSDYVIKQIQTEYVLKIVLEHYLNKKIEKLKVITNEFGKPSLLDETINYNITHSNSYLVIAVSNDNVGVDLQRSTNKAINIQSKLYNEILDRSVHQINKDFTIKEAYIKYYGKSILMDMKKIIIKKNTVEGIYGNLHYKNYFYNEYFLSIASLNEFNVDFYNVSSSNDLLSINKSNIMIKSEEEEE